MLNVQRKALRKERKDRGSLILLWLTILLCFVFGFTFANYGKWNLSDLIIRCIGLLIIIIGFSVRWMAIIQLKNAFTVDVAIGNDQNLKTDGAYKYIRHPSYKGLLIIMTGFAISMNTIISFLVIVIPMFLVVLYRISVEEALLVKAFGEKYIDYRNKTKKLIPWVF